MSTTLPNVGYNYWPNMQGYTNSTQSSTNNNLNSIYGMTNNNQNYMNDPYFMAAFQSPNTNAEIYAQQSQQAGAQQPTTAQPTGQVPTVPSAANQIAFEGKQSTATEPKKKNNAANWIVGLASVAGLIFCGYKCHGKGTGEGLSKIWDGAKKYWDQGINWINKKLPKLTFNKPKPTQAEIDLWHGHL